MGVIGKLDTIMKKQEKEISESDSNLIEIDSNEIKDKDNIISTSSRNEDINETIMDLKGDELAENKLDLNEGRNVKIFRKSIFQ